MKCSTVFSPVGNRIVHSPAEKYMSYTNEHIILKKLSGNPAKEVSVDELIEITDKYPAFGAGKYLLAKKMQSQQHENFQQYAQKAVLYFANPFWFHFKLNEESLMNDHSFLPKKEAPKNIKPDEVVEPTNPNVENTIAEEGHKDTGIVELLEQEPVADVTDSQVAPAMEDLAAEAAVIDNIIIGTGEEEEDIQVAEITQPTYDEQVEEATVIEPFVEVDTEDETVVQPPAAVVEDTSLQTETTHAQNDEYITDKAGFAEMAAGPEDVYDDTEGADGGGEEIMPPLNNDKITAILDEQLAEYKKPVTEETPVPIESEPYHTVDYFASQGIRLTKEQQSQDHLSVKVKKFTDWLKQMKRISPQPADLGIDEASESRVQNIAESSNETKEVVTEAMAEVLAKQGMNEKAVQVYTKLSFLYPDKSAYFATQIEHLKEK